MDDERDTFESEMIDEIRRSTEVEATPVGLRTCLTQLALEAEHAGYSYLAGKIRESAQCANDIATALKVAASNAQKRPRVSGQIVVPSKRLPRQH